MTLKGHFDGKVVVLDEMPPAEWLPNQPVLVSVAVAPRPETDDDSPCQTFLWLAARAQENDLGLPADFSEQHDHYIHGTPKR
jgi:hypothetical protein